MTEKCDAVSNSCAARCAQFPASEPTIFVEQGNNDLLSARNKNRRILTQHAPGRTRENWLFAGGMRPGNGIGKGARSGQNANAWISIVYYETMSARARNYPTFYHLFLLAGGCRANGKRRAQETRDRTAIRPDSRIPVAINHLAATFQQFENDLSLSLSLSLERTNERNSRWRWLEVFEYFGALEVEKGCEVFLFLYSLPCGEICETSLH